MADWMSATITSADTQFHLDLHDEGIIRGPHHVLWLINKLHQVNRSGKSWDKAEEIIICYNERWMEYHGVSGDTVYRIIFHKGSGYQIVMSQWSVGITGSCMRIADNNHGHWGQMKKALVTSVFVTSLSLMWQGQVLAFKVKRISFQ